jgi:hypothetical protein
VFSIGAALSAFGLVSPAGLEVGSVHWQPVFFSSICLVLGLQAALAGIVLANSSSLVGEHVRRAYGWVNSRHFAPACVWLGALVLVTGLALDGALFAAWLSGRTGEAALAVASVAQGLLICGGSLGTFGLVFEIVGRADRSLPYQLDRHAEPRS